MKRRISALAKRRNDTRRLYRFEEESLRAKPILPMATLIKTANRIWEKDGRGDLPPIVAGRGDFYNGRLYSYYDGEKIVLARNERRKFVLIHEIVHALGHDNHDAAFVNKYHKLLQKYDRTVNRPTLQSLRQLACPKNKSGSKKTNGGKSA